MQNILNLRETELVRNPFIWSWKVDDTALIFQKIFQYNYIVRISVALTEYLFIISFISSKSEITDETKMHIKQTIDMNSILGGAVFLRTEACYAQRLQVEYHRTKKITLYYYY